MGFQYFKKVILIASFCAVGLFLSSGALYAEVELPIPADAVKIREKTFDIGPSKSLVQFYETALAQDRLSNFYKKEMLRVGWRQQKPGYFIKDKYFVVLAIVPGVSKEQKTRFSLATSSIPSPDEISASRKVNPDKLDFMPVYPGCIQAFLWDLPTGISAAYETESSIKEVVFFYKSAMLNYGWRLYSETPVKTKEIDCPECKKKAPPAVTDKTLPKSSGTSSRVTLVFRRGDGESCLINVFRVEIDRNIIAKATPSLVDANTSFPDKTNITVTYNANKQINP